MKTALLLLGGVALGAVATLAILWWKFLKDGWWRW